MVTIGALWLPILLSAVAVWVASAIIWMVMPYHKSDFRKLPDEDAALRALTPQGLVPGQYSFLIGELAEVRLMVRHDHPDDRARQSR